MEKERISGRGAEKVITRETKQTSVEGCEKGGCMYVRRLVVTGVLQ